LLFAYLVAERGRAVPREELAEALWADAPPATWEKVLTVIVSKLRSVLADRGIDGAAALTGAFGCYRMELPAGTWVDVLVAADALREAEDALAAGNPAQAKAAAAISAPLLSQPFLPGEEGAWVDEKRREFADVRGRALAALADACLQSGDPAAAAKWAEQTVALAPFRETGYRRLMEAHVAAGNRAEALRVYEDCRRLLAEELGSYPSPETESLYRSLLETPAARATATADASPTGGNTPVNRACERPALVGASKRTLPRRRWPTWLALGVVGIAVAAGAVAAAVTLTRGASGKPLARLDPNSIGVIDPSKNALVGEIRLATRPAAIAVGNGSVWVAMEDDQTLLRLDSRTHKVIRTIGLGATPTALAAAGRYVWVFCEAEQTVTEVDAGTATVIRTLPLKGRMTVGSPNEWSPAAIAADPQAAWLAVGPGLLTRIDAVTGSIERVGTGSASAVAVADATVWAVGSLPDIGNAGMTYRIDGRTHRVTETVPPPNIAGVTGAKYQIAATTDVAWVIHDSGVSAWRVDSSLERVTAVVPITQQAVAIAGDGGGVWTANANGTISRIDPRTATLLTTIPLGRYPRLAYPAALAVGDGAVWVVVH
jgi:DNA-binding SARP family transcriptional activator/DNA-binding beta-propeller fold protein YncE